MAFGGLLSVKLPDPVTGATTMLSGPVTVNAGLLESVALTVKDEVPASVGIPLTTQLADRLKPSGSVPAVWSQV